MSDLFFDELEEEISFGSPRVNRPVPARESSPRRPVDEKRSLSPLNPLHSHKTSPSVRPAPKHPEKTFSKPFPPRRPHNKKEEKTISSLPLSQHLHIPSYKGEGVRIFSVGTSSRLFLYETNEGIVMIGSGWGEQDSKKIFADIRVLTFLKKKVVAWILPSLDRSFFPSIRIVSRFLDIPELVFPLNLKDLYRSAFPTDRTKITSLLEIKNIGNIEVKGEEKGITFFLPQFSLNHGILPLNEKADIAFHHEKSECTTSSGIVTLGEGKAIEIISPASVNTLPLSIKLESLVLDGHGLGLEKSHVAEIRAQMGQAGVIVVVFIVDTKTRAIVGKLDIETRGVIYPHEARDVHRLIEKSSRSSYEQTIRDVPDIEEKDLIKIIKHDLEKSFFDRVHRKPLIIPIIVRC